MHTLVVNDIVAKELGIKKYVNLFPTLKESVPWSISLDEYVTINDFISKFSDEITNHLTDLNILEINSNLEALQILIRPNVGMICYIIIYRLIRVLRLLDKYDSSDLTLINTRYFKPNGISDLYNLSRDSWEFNQFIVNGILYDVEKVDLEKKKDIYPNNYWDSCKWSNHEGFNRNPASIPKRNKIKTFINDPVKAIRSKFIDLAFKLSSYGSQIPVLAMSYNELFLLKNGFFWPRGKFCKLPQNLPQDTDVFGQDYSLRKKISKKTKQYFIDSVLNLLKKLKIKLHHERYVENISNLFFKIYPISMLEQAEEYSTWSYKQISKFKCKNYFTDHTGSSDLSIYYNYAASELGFKVWSQQHSALGGYMANIPNIADLQIAGADYYITSGWDHEEPHLPVWKKKAIPMSSPAFSEIKSKIISVKKSNPVLLLTGEVFSFPILPAGSHEVDTLMFWAESIENIICNITALGIEINIKSYSPLVERLMIRYGILEKWMRAGGDKVKLVDGNKKGTAHLYFHQSSCTICDMPGGAFVESYMKGLPAFSFWNKNFLRCQPEAENEIKNLIEVGIFNQNGKDMAKNVGAYITKKDWWNDCNKKAVLDSFMTHYINTSKKWKNEWSTLVKNL